MIINKNMAKWLISILFILTIIPFLSSANENKSNDYHQLEQLQQNPNLLTIKGTIPIFYTEEEKTTYSDIMYKCRRESASEIEQYMLSNGGPVVGFGYNENGYFRVVYDETPNRSFDNTTINEIYQILNTKCQLENINEVPVVFFWGETPINDIGESGEPSTPNIPGFSLIIGIIGLFAQYVIKKE